MPITVKDLLEAGVHFGHQAHRWNPKMAPYLFDKRTGVHIIDLDQTLGYLHQAQEKVKEITNAGGKILFVGTKRQGKDAVKAAAERAGMPYVTERWLGGMLTNFETIKQRLDRLKKLTEEEQSGGWDRLPKKEVARKRDEQRRLSNVLSGIKDLTEVPAAMYVSDVVREDLAVAEARKLNLPVIAVLDSNADPALADYPIPGNDDAVKAITVVAEAIADAALEGAGHFRREEAKRVAAAEVEKEKAEKAAAKEAAKEAEKSESAPSSAPQGATAEGKRPSGSNPGADSKTKGDT